MGAVEQKDFAPTTDQCQQEPVGVDVPARQQPQKLGAAPPLESLRPLCPSGPSSPTQNVYELDGIVGALFDGARRMVRASVMGTVAQDIKDGNWEHLQLVGLAGITRRGPLGRPAFQAGIREALPTHAIEKAVQQLPAEVERVYLDALIARPDRSIFKSQLDDALSQCGRCTGSHIMKIENERPPFSIVKDVDPKNEGGLVVQTWEDGLHGRPNEVKITTYQIRADQIGSLVVKLQDLVKTWASRVLPW